jgi:hypothetical protein
MSRDAPARHLFNSTVLSAFAHTSKSFSLSLAMVFIVRFATSGAQRWCRLGSKTRVEDAWFPPTRSKQETQTSAVFDIDRIRRWITIGTQNCKDLGVEDILWRTRGNIFRGGVIRAISDSTIITCSCLIVPRFGIKTLR